MNPFGVEHAPLSKSYSKMAPKLVRSGTQIPQKTDTLQERFRVNYRQWRSKAGALESHVNPHNFDASDAKYGIEPSKRVLDVRAKGRSDARKKARNLKEGAQAMITGHANAGKRDRFLP